MKILMLVNPNAGQKKGTTTALQAKKLFENSGITLEMKFSTKAGEMLELSKKAVNATWDGIVAVGGDGTLFEIINGMMQVDESLPIPLGIIPVGTGNSFSRELKLKSLEDTVQRILTGKTIQVDLGKCECSDDIFYFINLLGFGFVSDVAHKANDYKKLGALSYIIGVLIITAKLSSYHLELEIDGQKYERENCFVEICNSTKTGGDMLMAPMAQINDGLLDVIILNKINRRRLLAAFPKIFKGTHLELPEAETFKAKKIVARPAIPKILTPDGEIKGQTPITVTVLPQKIKIFA
ncbi:diacylglycerol kinase family lipid kinase [candidate division KSB1 bacterium]|nr:diacylglycerol kinase family lipid kinase [candidate division KSB1 bacterium]